MSYQISAHKYRPQRFEEVVGQDAVVTTLKNALVADRLAPAYLFCGSQGTGKTTLARLLAKAMNCRSITPTGEPCETCPCCLDTKEGRSLDIIEIDGASNRGIDDIRTINETIGYAPTSGKYKIYIIDEVHMLTKEAFNALLKTLEEPPAHVKFFFATTELHKVLPTIVSRCQRFDLHRIPLPLMTKKLRQIADEAPIDVTTSALEIISERAEGSLRDAESLFDQVVCFAQGSPLTNETIFQALGLIPEQLFFQLDRAVSNYDLSFAFSLAEDLFTSGKEFSTVLEGLISHYRTLLLYKLNPHAPIKNPLHAESVSLYTQEQCLYLLDFLMRTLQQTLKTPFKRPALEMTLLHLIRSHKRIPIEVLVQRLAQLEQSKHSVQPILQPPYEESPQQVPLPAAVQETNHISDSAESVKQQAPPAPVSRKQQSQYDTIIRFAAVELEGTVSQ